MSLEPDLAEFVAHHRPHGPLTRDATEPTPNGYMVSVGCSCSVVFMRLGIAVDVAEEAMYERVRKL